MSHICCQQVYFDAFVPHMLCQNHSYKIKSKFTHIKFILILNSNNHNKNEEYLLTGNSFMQLLFSYANLNRSFRS